MILLRAYAIVTTLVIVVLATAAFQPSQKSQNLGEITVERINVVDKDGTLRMVISNKDRMHPGVIDGKVIDRPRPVAGFLFFNDEGDEVGGLTYTGRVKDGARNASSGLNLDQLKQDQTIGFGYSESNGRKTAAFQVWDPPDANLGELIDKLNAANQIQDAARRAAAVQAARDGFPPRPRRVLVGKTADRAATVSLSDASGKPRLNLTVDADGNPRIESLDENGKVIQRWPAQQ
ncbi:MAG: hypothetical protein AUH43_26615 [Acidobacteria bacterium 13_1_40CM_65_14]|jgi:hypothetical protein|nr:MAG: hypothetical protein AUH43_26615 [Acidobacteria bacterium 13_1_40CM_65_14]OLC77744.1 MAG: hypothetical protein AUH72_17050 [Acidobacteria bacterium 13_1_40CM_4_65_8]OLD16521.1 MAG: hypothetical protein AUJ01_10330 [Acidobacteria bacterium 13_1_40CM_3_65_5]